MDIIKDNPDKPWFGAVLASSRILQWSWFYISQKQKNTWDMVVENPEMTWIWSVLGEHPMIRHLETIT